MPQLTDLEIIAIILLSLIGFRFLLSILRGVWTCFLGYSLGFGIKWKTGDNIWAVVTGGTDGIGLEYAKQLAKIGYNLVIISRSEDKLKATAKTIKDNYNKEVKTITADFGQTDIYERISEELNKLDEIFVLVNNVGTIYHIPEYYLNVPKDYNESLLNINLISVTKLIQIVLPKMLDKKRGIIINVSSSISETFIPLYTAYGATKSYMSYLSELLSVEYESNGVYIQTVIPNQVQTKLTKEVTVPIISVTPEVFVSAALKTVGIEYVTNGHWKHKLFAYLTRLLIFVLGKRNAMKLMLFNTIEMRRKYYKTNNLADN